MSEEEDFGDWMNMAEDDAEIKKEDDHSDEEVI
jgi:hypothetical protein